ncbi:MAG: hypothetical protein HYX68_18035 [Planctomycetes bacterium]|nr:hypothetical protein [Planctomycetota bacterium]
MRTVYACVLDVVVRSPETSAQGFERLWTTAAQWIEAYYRDRYQVECRVVPDQPKLSPRPQHGVQGQRAGVAGVCELAALEWSYPDELDAGLQWIHACQFARNGPKLEASVSIRIVSTHPIAKPLHYNLERPAIVDQILHGFPCAIGKSPIPLKPRELEKFDADLFVEETLCSADRWLPVVVISPQQGVRDYLLDPAELQQKLLGHAQVVALRDVGAGRAWTDALGVKELSCYLGAVRLYWPGFTRRSKPSEHPLYMADSIRWHIEQHQPLGQHLFRSLVAVSGFRFSNPPTARLVREAIDSDRHARFHTLLKNAKAHEESGQILQELERAWDQIKILEQERNEARNQAAELTRELEAQKEAWQGYRGQRPAASEADTPAPRGPIKTVAEAVERAAADFPDTLTFLPDAIESARQSPYRWPEKVYALFEALAELTHLWQQKGSLGTGWHDALKPKGFDYAEFISPTAKGKYGDEYTFRYEGVPVLFEHHVTLGARSADTCISTHWFRDEARKRLVIGWCGKHLSNTQS